MKFAKRLNDDSNQVYELIEFVSSGPGEPYAILRSLTTDLLSYSRITRLQIVSIALKGRPEALPISGIVGGEE